MIRHLILSCPQQPICSWLLVPSCPSLSSFITWAQLNFCAEQCGRYFVIWGSSNILERKNKAEGRQLVTYVHPEWRMAPNGRSQEETEKKLSQMLPFLCSDSHSHGLMRNGILKILPMTKEMDTFFDHRYISAIVMCSNSITVMKALNMMSFIVHVTHLWWQVRKENCLKLPICANSHVALIGAISLCRLIKVYHCRHFNYAGPAGGCPTFLSPTCCGILEEEQSPHPVCLPTQC